MAVPFNRYNCLTGDLMKKVHNLSTDGFKAMLSNTAPTATHTLPSQVVGELAAGNGYLTGGFVLDNPAVTVDGVDPSKWRWFLDDELWTASGGSIGPYRYIIIYNNTATKLVGWFDRGSSVTLADGDSGTMNLDNVNGVFSLP